MYDSHAIRLTVGQPVTVPRDHVRHRVPVEPAEDAEACHSIQKDREGGSDDVDASGRGAVTLRTPRDDTLKKREESDGKGQVEEEEGAAVTEMEERNEDDEERYDDLIVVRVETDSGVRE